jgi:hypothetical protein
LYFVACIARVLGDWEGKERERRNWGELRLLLLPLLQRVLPYAATQDIYFVFRMFFTIDLFNISRWNRTESQTYFHNISMIFPYYGIEFQTYFQHISMIFPCYGIRQNHRN